VHPVTQNIIIIPSRDRPELFHMLWLEPTDRASLSSYTTSTYNKGNENAELLTNYHCLRARRWKSKKVKLSL
jgi:hypothetical protein